MTDKLVDPFDDPQTLGRMRGPAAAPPAPQAASQGGLIDPFDNPGFLDQVNAERMKGRVSETLQRAFGQPARAGGAKTLQETAGETYAFDDRKRRGSILPRGETHSGEMVFAAPQWLKNMAESALLPGHVAKGGSYTADDALGFTLDYAIPGSQGRAPAKRGDFARQAPSTNELRAQSRRYKDEAVKSGVRVTPDSYTDFVADIETMVRANRLNKGLHPGSSNAFDELSSAVGQEMDVDDLHTLRRLVGSAMRSTDPDKADDRRIAGLIQERLDEYVDNLQSKDIVTGDPTKLGGNLKMFRSLYSRSKKSEQIEEIIAKAERQASGFENGIRIGFRNLLNRRGGTKGFTKAEIHLMEQIASGGTSGQKLMRLLGKLSFDKQGGSNFLGGSIGVAGGSAAGSTVAGPLGAAIGGMTAPVVGAAGQRAAEKLALDNAMLARAMVATGRSAPPNSLSLNTLRGILERSGGPLVNSLSEQMPQRRTYRPEDIL